MSPYLVARCLLMLEISSSPRDVLADGWTAQPGGHTCAPCAERLLVHPEVSHPMRLTELNAVPVLSTLIYV